jgi:hypothetical protein
MGRSFEEILAKCLEAVAQGQLTVEDCLSLYPDLADRLEPELRLALGLRRAYLAQAPSAQFQAGARQRFLSAARTREAVPPSVSVQGRLAQAVSAIRHRFAPPGALAKPALAVALILVLTFAGFSSFVMATSGDTLPGDWRYPAKRLTERVRLTFAFGDETKRDVRIDIAAERLWELENMAARSRPIGDRLLRELAESTDSLVDDLDSSPVPAPQIERISNLTAQQQQVLEQVTPLVTEDAADELDVARQVSSDGHERALFALSLAQASEEGGGPDEALAPTEGTPGGESTRGSEATPGSTAAAEPSPTGTPSAGATPTPEGEEEAAAAGATPTPEGEEEAVASSPTAEPEKTQVPPAPPPPAETPEAAPTATAGPPAPTPEPVMASAPKDAAGGIAWSEYTMGNFSVRVPAPRETDWAISRLRNPDGNEVLFVGHRFQNRFDAVVTIEVATAEASVGVLIDGAIVTTDLQTVSDVQPALKEIIRHIVASAVVRS